MDGCEEISMAPYYAVDVQEDDENEIAKVDFVRSLSKMNLFERFRFVKIVKPNQRLIDSKYLDI